MNIVSSEVETEEKHTKETALYFLNNQSEKNKQIAFLRYYGDERNEENNTQAHLSSLRI